MRCATQRAAEDRAGTPHSIDRDSLAPDIEVGAADRVLLACGARVDRRNVLAASVDAKAAASSEEEVSHP